MNTYVAEKVSVQETEELSRIRFELGRLRSMQAATEKYFPNISLTKIKAGINFLASRLVELNTNKEKIS